MSDDFANKIRSVNFGAPRRARVRRDPAGADAKVVESIREDDGTTGGFHRHHADGRVDAVVEPQTVRMTPNTLNPGA